MGQLINYWHSLLPEDMNMRPEFRALHARLEERRYELGSVQGTTFIQMCYRYSQSAWSQVHPQYYIQHWMDLDAVDGTGNEAPPIESMQGPVLVDESRRGEIRVEPSLGRAVAFDEMVNALRYGGVEFNSQGLQAYWNTLDPAEAGTGDHPTGPVRERSTARGLVKLQRCPSGRQPLRVVQFGHWRIRLVLLRLDKVLTRVPLVIQRTLSASTWPRWW